MVCATWTKPAVAAEVCVLDANLKEYDLRPYMEVLADPTKELSITEIASPDRAAKFGLPKQGHFNFGVTKNALWFRFTIRQNLIKANNKDKTTLWVFDPGWNLYDKFELFVPDSKNPGKWLHYVSGRFSTPSWSMEERHFVLPTDITSPITCYIRAVGFRPIVLNPRIATFERTIWLNSLKVFGLAVLIGFFLTMAVAQFAILIYTKDGRYKWFFMGNLTFIGYTASSSYQYIVNFQNLPTIIMVFGMLAQAIMLSVVRAFLETKRILKYTDLLLLTCIWSSYILAIVIFFSPDGLQSDLVMKSAVITTAVGAGVCIYCYKTKKVIALIFMAAWTGITTAVGLFTYAAHGGMEFAHPSIVWYGFVFEAVCHSILLAYSVKLVILERQKAELNAQAKTTFLASMSHEIRTPMTAVMGFLNLALQINPTGRLRRYLIKIRTSAIHLMGIINDILDVAKIEAGKIELELSPFDLEALLQDTADILVTRAFENANELVISFQPDIPRSLVGDTMRLKQILVNLGGNAVKFTRNGTVLLAVSRAEAPHPDGMVSLRFSVHDTGIGIDPAILPHLFEPFSQAETSTTRVYGGTGLGLNISHRLTNLMGAELTATSEPGKGSTFEFTATLQIASNDNAPLKSKNDYNTTRVLVIEDNWASWESIHEIMNHLGLSHSLARTMKEALDLAASKNFDLFLLDWDLPDMPGPEAAANLRNIPHVADTPIVFMTNMARPEAETLQPERFCVDALLAKPFTPSSVEDLLRKIIYNEDTTWEERDATLATEKINKELINGINILLAEDNQFNQELIRVILEESGAKLEIVNNGKEAVSRIMNEQIPRPDVVLMDLHMPIMDGYEATKAIREIARYQNLPIIAMTADVMKEDKEQCFRAGMNGHLTKPIDTAALFSALAEVAAKNTPRN